eukprot:16272407-Heterocapsa_arctica.AAC.1
MALGTPNRDTRVRVRESVLMQLSAVQRARTADSRRESVRPDSDNCGVAGHPPQPVQWRAGPISHQFLTRHATM